MGFSVVSNPIFRAALVGAGYFLGAWLGVHYTITPDGIAIIWPANAVALTAFLLAPRRQWPLLALAIVLAECAADIPAFPLPATLAFAIVNLFETLVATLLIQRLAGNSFRFQSIREVVIFILAAPFLASSVAATMGAAIYEIMGRTDSSYFALWRLWWFGDAVGLVLLTPLLHSACVAVSAEKRRVEWRALGELAVVFALLASVGAIVFGVSGQGDLAFHLTPVLLLPFAVWVATRFGTLASATSVAIIAAMAIAYLVSGRSAYVAAYPQHAVWLTQEYLAVVSLISIGISVLMQEIRQQRNALLLQDRALRASNDAVIIADARLPDMPITWVNPKFEALFGYRADEVIGRNCRLLQQGVRDDKDALKTVRSALLSRSSCRVQLQNFTKDGKPLWIELSLAPVQDAAGHTTHYVGIQHDLTRERESERRLRDATEALQRHNESLEETVQARTQSLVAANAELHLANRQLQELATTDYLTGIANRRHFYEMCERELRRLRQDGLPAVLVALDLDHFKSVNDRFGHDAGDEVLRQFVQPIQAHVRPHDLFGRIGGEEFLLLLPNTEVRDAVVIAERMRTQIAQCVTRHGGNEIHITASLGLAPWEGNCDLDELIRRADLALYAAKNGGRDTLRVWPEV